MRRIEIDARGPPPFRILGDGVSKVYVVPPPQASTTLAPEPYKVGGTVSSTGYRARRRSSFVIIAEARPATPSSRSPSPNPASGRASPFRGRGFKGPLPHAQSRPQTPEGNVKETRRPSRIDRRMSISQQNSPKRTLIPQPARRRSVSLSKTENGQGRSSPKFGRRAASRNHLEVGQPAVGRRGSVKAPGLSPIQGTPTKPLEKRPSQNGLGTKRPSPLKSRRNSLAPPGPKTGVRVGAGSVRSKPGAATSKEKGSEGVPTSPSRIPLKKVPSEITKVQKKIPGGLNTSVQNSRRGSLAKLSVPKNVENKLDNRGKKINDQKVDQKLGPGGSQKKTDKEKNSKTPNPGDKSNAAAGNGPVIDGPDSVNAKTEPHESPNLMELLKQSSGASGTSSVVNTTTVTAAQPLQIDAVQVVDDEKEKEPEVKRRNVESGRRNGAARPTAINLDSPSLATLQGKTQRHTNSGNNSPPRVENKHVETPTREARTNGPKNQQKKITESGEPIESSVKNDGEESSENKIQDNPVSENQTSNRQQIGSGNVDVIAARLTNRDKNGPHGSVIPDKIESQSKIAKGSSNDSLDGRSTVKSSGRTVRSENRGVEVGEGVTPVDVVSSDRSGSSSAVVEEGGVIRRGEELVIGSAASLKSTAGISRGSTDTGVSVNTVRGVSSAREKRGMHMVKQPQGIETLSGNVVHLEQNGEPMLAVGAGNSEPLNTNLPDSQQSNPVESSSPESESRWKRIFGRCCGCCKCDCSSCSKGRIMRCLACRRGLKSQNQNQPGQMFQEPTNRTTGCLSKLKSSSKCCPLPRWKGCSRGSRVAPSENGGCCPPERKFGAIFRRLCSWCCCRCSCCCWKGHDVVQQTGRNVQAKQSLTSVAAPVLPEEPKSKIPEVLVEHNALMRGAIPCLPIPLAWFCLVWNVLIPGTGTFWSGLFNLCVGQPRFSTVATPRARFGAFLVNTVVGVGQLFTVLFCLVGWGWSIWWGVMMVRLARKYKRFRDSEAANNDVEARGGNETSTNAPPGVPSQALRGVERAR